MTQKTTGYIEMVWSCPNCQTKNRGSVRYCSSCGAAQPKDVKFEKPIQEELITDEKKLEEAAAGPDIYCAYCGNRNPATAKNCQLCGADLGEGEARASGEVFQSSGSAASGTPIVCGACGAENPAAALECKNCGAPLNSTEKTVPPSEPKKPANRAGCVLAAVVLAALLFGLIWLFTKTEEKIGTVIGKKWSTSVAIEEIVTKTDSAWRDQVPSRGSIVRCSSSVRRTSSSYIAGAEEVCGAPYYVDRGNGYSEQVQDCEYRVYDDYCDYTYKDWDIVDRANANGTDDEPYYPESTLRAGQREGLRSVRYQVEFSGDGDKTYQYVPETLDEYVSFSLHQEYLLEVNLLDAVVKYELKR